MEAEGSTLAAASSKVIADTSAISAALASVERLQTRLNDRETQGAVHGRVLYKTEFLVPLWSAERLIRRLMMLMVAKTGCRWCERIQKSNRTRRFDQNSMAH